MVSGVAPVRRPKRATFPRETIRLVFAVPAEVHLDDAIGAAMKAVGAVPRRPIDRRFAARYWDTAAGDLARAGIWFETGNGIGRFALRQGPLGARTWTFDAPEETPALRSVPASRMLPDLVRDADLAPVLERTGQRLMWEATREGIVVASEQAAWSAVQASVDARLLTVEGPVRTGPALVDLALALAVPLSMRLLPGPQEASIADRLAGRAAAAARVATSALDPSSDAVQGLVAIGRAALHQMLGNLGAVVDAGSAESVHQFRVGLRRLRSALRLFRDRLEVDARKALSADLRWLNRVFADAREWDVFLAQTLAPLAEGVEGTPLAGLADAATAERELAYAALRQALAGPEPTRILLTLARWFEVGAIPVRDGVAPMPLQDFARDALRRTRRRLRRRHAALSTPTAAEWHDLRILGKQARYAADAFRSLYPKRASRPYLAALEGLQDCLGGANDALVARRLAARLAADRPDADLGAAVALVDGWAIHQQMAGRRDFERLWPAFRRIAPFWRGD